MKAAPLAKVRAKRMRRELSPPELKLWLRLRARANGSPIFRRQAPIGPFIADFFCAKSRVVFEIDGDQHGEDAARRHDRQKDGYMRSVGLRVVRIPAWHVLRDADVVADYMRHLALHPEEIVGADEIV
jgi:very-short-patch-repair endonuclease